MCTRWAPWTRMRSDPSGTFIIRATEPTTPTRYSESGPGVSCSGSFEATMTSIRLPARTSLTSSIERSWPTARGVRVSGSGTVSRSGRTGRVRGIARSPISTSWPSPDAAMSIKGSPRRGVRPRLLIRMAGLRPSYFDRNGPCAPLLHDQRKLDPQDAVAVGGLRLVGDDIRAERDRPAERAEVDLELLVEAPLGVRRAPMAGDH